MKNLHIKVLLETDQLVFRDLKASGQHNLEDLHFAILKAFGFKGKEMASFLQTGDGWQAQAEFPLESVSPEKDGSLMKNTPLSKVFEEEGDALSYIYDYLVEWKFELELIEVEEGESVKEIELINSHGKAPKENERDLSGEDAEKILMNAILGDDLMDEDEDDLFDDDDFESLDDYEEFL